MLKKNDNIEIKEKEQNESVKKESEKLEIMKKQQLGKIKNIIDYAYKMKEFRKKMKLKLNYKMKKNKN